MTGRHDDPVGGRPRTPTFSVRIGAERVIAPPIALAGCEIEDGWYVAPALGVLQDARVGRGSRLADLYCARRNRAPARWPRRACVATLDGEERVLLTADIDAACAAIAGADFSEGALSMSTAIEACCIQAAAKPSCNRQLRMDRRAGHRPRLGPIPLIRHARPTGRRHASLSQLSRTSDVATTRRPLVEAERKSTVAAAVLAHRSVRRTPANEGPLPSSTNSQALGSQRVPNSCLHYAQTSRSEPTMPTRAASPSGQMRSRGRDASAWPLRRQHVRAMRGRLPGRGDRADAAQAPLVSRFRSSWAPTNF